MNEQERRTLVEDYLHQLDTALRDLPASRRRDLVEDVRGHIDEAWAESTEQNRAALLNILERLGEPSALAAEERYRLGLPDAEEERRPGLLEIAAVALTVFFWPVGVVLAWLSPRWSTLDKTVATMIPLVGLALVLTTSMVAFTVMSPRSARVTVQQVEVGSSSPSSEPQKVTVETPEPVQQISKPTVPWASTLRDLFVRLAALFGVVGAPITSGLYLALRMGPRPRRAALLLPAAVVLGILVLLVVSFAPLASA